MRISLCIPTRERAHYLRECLATCVAIDDPDLEIIVSDNASRDGTEPLVKAFADPRVKYVNTGRRVSMRQNFETAVAATTGDFVIIIGDDDAMLPGQFAVLRALLETENPECLTWRARAYRWVEGEFLSRGGIITQPESQAYGAVTRHNIRDTLDAILGSNFQEGSFVPRLYHGAIRRDVIERVKAKTGMVFHSHIPDVYFSVAVGAFAEEFLFVEHPFSIGGAGRKSTGRSHTRTEAAQAGDAADMFLDEVETDFVVDPIPERMPTLGFALLNATEQANRIAYDGGLKLNYLRLFEACIDELANKNKADFDLGLGYLRTLAASLDDRVMLLALINRSEFDSRRVWWRNLRRRAFKAFQSFETIARQSWVTRDKFWLMTPTIGQQEVALAADILDWCLGTVPYGTGQQHLASLDREEAWSTALRRAMRLAIRSWFRLAPPAGLARATAHLPATGTGP